MNNRMNEPLIQINGYTLSEGQAMTIRVALESFNIDLINDGLGDDSHGRKMTEIYQERINEIRAYLYSQFNNRDFKQ